MRIKERQKRLRAVGDEGRNRRSLYEWSWQVTEMRTRYRENLIEANQ